jgi:hypothetical protein
MPSLINARLGQEDKKGKKFPDSISKWRGLYKFIAPTILPWLSQSFPYANFDLHRSSFDTTDRMAPSSVTVMIIDGSLVLPLLLGPPKLVVRHANSGLGVVEDFVLAISAITVNHME